MRDSTTPGVIPLTGLAIAAGYVNGKYAWTPADWSRFIQAGVQMVRIDVAANAWTAASILDVETGDATPDAVPGWVKNRHAAFGDVPVIYCSRDALTPVFNACQAAGLSVVRDFRLWIATLDGTPAVADMTGVVAVQAYGSNRTGGNYDESIVYDDTWHPSAQTPPPPPHLVSVTATAKFSDGSQRSWTV